MHTPHQTVGFHSKFMLPSPEWIQLWINGCEPAKLRALNHLAEQRVPSCGCPQLFSIKRKGLDLTNIETGCMDIPFLIWSNIQGQMQQTIRISMILRLLELNGILVFGQDNCSMLQASSSQCGDAFFGTQDGHQRLVICHKCEGASI